MAIPKKVADRVRDTLKRFQNVLQEQRARDVSEADTVTIVKDMLSEMFGYDKYAELTSEHSIRGTYCDLAVKLEAKLSFLIEVKAIGLDLKESHIKQAVDYAANQGCEWVVLTNGIQWYLYHVLFKKPIDKQELASFDLLKCNAKSEDDLETIYLLTREGFTRNALVEYRDRKDASSHYVMAAILLNSDAVQSAIRREIRRVSDVMLEPEVIVKALRDQVIKREALEGDKAAEAQRRVLRTADKSIRRNDEKPPAASAAEPTVPAT